MIFRTGFPSLGLVQLYEISSLYCCLLILPANQTTISLRILWGNRVGDGVRHSFIVLWIYNECSVSQLTWRIRQESLIRICKLLLAGDVSKSPFMHAQIMSEAAVSFYHSDCFWASLFAFFLSYIQILE